MEAYFGQPQDMGWCLINDTFHIVQSRPIKSMPIWTNTAWFIAISRL
ncbi:hypothetical protein ACE3MQ_01105 [Paenibacillus lentus]